MYVYIYIYRDHDRESTTGGGNLCHGGGGGHNLITAVATESQDLLQRYQTRKTGFHSPKILLYSFYVTIPAYTRLE